jgi:ATP-binding cassette subfamily F protein uup
VLDEPTNDLDLMTLSVLEEALNDFPGCALIVSHDRWFLDRVATSILAFEGDGRVVFHEGDYSTYLQRRARELRDQAKATGAAAPGAPAAGKGRGPKAPPPKKLSFAETRELAGMEAAITAAEAKVTELEAALQDPAIYKDRAAEVPAMIAALEAAKGQVERLYGRWQALEALQAEVEAAAAGAGPKR